MRSNFMEDDVAKLVEEFERSQGDIFFWNEEGLGSVSYSYWVWKKW